MKNFIKITFVLFLTQNTFVTHATDTPNTFEDCYDRNGRIYHSKINPQDFNQEGHLLSETTVEKIKSFYEQNGSRISCKISKTHKELFLEGETPRSILFIDNQLFILYRDFSKSKRQSYLGFRPIKGKRQANIPFLYETGKRFVKVEDKVKLAWNISNKEFVAIRVSFAEYLPDEDQNIALKNKGLPNERAALKKLGRLSGETIRQKKTRVKEEMEELDEDSKETTLNLIYSVEKFIPGKPLDQFLKSSQDPAESKIATISALNELQHIHDLGIIHEDVWGLHNFLYDTNDKNALLIDFETSIVEGYHTISSDGMKNKVIEENRIVLKPLLKALAESTLETHLNKTKILSLLNMVEEKKYLETLKYYIDELSSF